MNIPQPRYFDNVAAGEPLPSAEIVVSITALVMYAAATWDFHRYHYDSAFVKQLGLPAPLMDGQMIGALLARQLMQWGGPDAFVRRINYRQRAAVYLDDTIVIAGRVTGTSVEGGRKLATCSLSVAKADGTAVVRDATATVEIGWQGT